MVNEARRLALRYSIPVDETAMHRRAAWSALRAGRRLRAVRHYASAIAGGDVRSIGRAVVALVHPAVGNDRLFRFAGRDSTWIAEAERWLGAFATDVEPSDRSSARAPVSAITNSWVDNLTAYGTMTLSPLTL